MMRSLFDEPPPAPDPEGVLAMIFNHARTAGWFGLPRSEYADADAEQHSRDGYAVGLRQRAAEDVRAKPDPTP